MCACRTSTGSSAGIGAETGLDPRFRVERWRLPENELPLGRPLVMGILNLTPDSFSDGGELASTAAALRRAERMVEEGAAILDVGGESTRPGAREVPVEEELGRVVPFLRQASARLPVPLSIDTRKAEVARVALAEGAQIVNDVSGLTHDPDLGSVVAEAGAGLVLMHMRGSPATMKERARYDDLLGEVQRELADSLERAREAGVAHDAVVLDPGIGFAKSGEQSLSLLRHLERLRGLGRPLLVGPSRKSFLGELLGRPPGERIAGTIAACVLAYHGGAQLFRVHDVREVADALRVAEAIEGAPE